MNIITRLMPKTITAVERFSGSMSPQIMAAGNIKYFVTSMKLFTSF